MRQTLIDERTAWMQRIQATLFHHGIGGTPDKLRTRAGREFLAALRLPQDARERIVVALAMVARSTRRSPRWSASCAGWRAARPAARR